MPESHTAGANNADAGNPGRKAHAQLCAPHNENSDFLVALQRRLLQAAKHSGFK